MAKAYADPIAALDAMLDTFEAQPERKAAILVEPDYAGIPDTERLERFVQIAREAEAAGAIVVEMMRGFDSHQIRRLRLVDAEALYRYLGRERGSDIADRAVDGIREALGSVPDWMVEALEDARERWATRRSYKGFETDDADEVVKVLKIARTLAAGKIGARDARSFSTEVCGDSKALERNRNAIAALLAEATGESAAPDQDALARFGIFTYPDPVMVKGPVLLADSRFDLSAFRPYAAVPEGNVADLRCARRPSYVLTIENKTSFHRHVREVCDDGVVVFTGGFPSRATAAALKAIAASSVGAPWFHWGDVDGGGLRIFGHIEETIVRPSGARLAPHLMTEDLARRHGVRARRRTALRRLAEADSAIADLARYLAFGENVHVLEQEALAPTPPVVTEAAAI